MAYKLKCNHCGNTFVSSSRTAQCPRSHSGYTTASFIGEVVGTAVELAVAYVVADAVSDVIGDVVGSLFDW